MVSGMDVPLLLFFANSRSAVNSFSFLLAPRERSNAL